MLAILSDIHGNLPALEAVIADADARGCTRFVNLGDIVSGPLWPRETADLLMARDWLTIRGNHERQLLTLERRAMSASDLYAADQLTDAHREWIRALPEAITIDQDVLLCHGSPRSDVEYFLEHVEERGLRPATPDEMDERAGRAAERMIFCGHTHRQRFCNLGRGRQVANPGSVGLQAFRDDLPFPHAVEAGSPEARYAIFANRTVHLLAVAYDHESAARQAERNGRPDWVLALRYGRMSQE